jgi:hypothetical protein
MRDIRKAAVVFGCCAIAVSAINCVVTICVQFANNPHLQFGVARNISLMLWSAITMPLANFVFQASMAVAVILIARLAGRTKTGSEQQRR